MSDIIYQLLAPQVVIFFGRYIEINFYFCIILNIIHHIVLLDLSQEESQKMRMGGCFLGVSISLSISVTQCCCYCRDMSKLVDKSSINGKHWYQDSNHMILEVVKVVECEHQTHIKLHCRSCHKTQSHSWSFSNSLNTSWLQCNILWWTHQSLWTKLVRVQLFIIIENDRLSSCL